VLAVFGRWIPTRVRVFLLALAVLDDLIAILIIAFFFTNDADLGALGFAAIAIALFGAVSRIMKPRSNWILARKAQWPINLALVVLWIFAWYFVYQSGVHATIAGVALGLVMARRPAGRAVHALEPVSNGIILPLFAFSAAMVAVPQVRPSELDPAFWGILVGLPVGKVIGITLAGWLGGLVAHRRQSGTPLTLSDLAIVGALGGIGFTVSLLMNELAFAGLPDVADEGTLAVLLGSGAAMALSAVVVTLRSRQYRRRGEHAGMGGAFSH
jgi:NhaA family Na+:H+ antiporter